jgi:ribosomal protein S18 acetylase RimI-like enzyme
MSGEVAYRERARTFEAWSGAVLVGLVAAYFDADARSCFISNVSVCREFAGKGVGSALVGRCLESARAAGLETVALEVHGDGRAAVCLYEKVGFRTAGGKEGMVRMELRMDGEGKT